MCRDRESGGQVGLRKEAHAKEVQELKTIEEEQKKEETHERF